MKSRISKIAIGLALALLGGGTLYAVHTEAWVDVMDSVLLFADIPDRLSDAVSNFKTLPERMDPTCSECN